MPHEEAVLIRRFREGDEEAFRILLERHVPAVQAQVGRLIPARIQRRVSVADVLQEARLVAFQRRADFEDRGAGSFRRWLLGIVRNKLHELVRRHDGAARRSARREVSRGQRADTAQFAGTLPSPSQAAIAAELTRFARKALGTLPEDDQEVLRLVRTDGLNLKQAAARMERTHEATKKLYGRALSRFGRVFARMTGGSHGPR